MVFISHVHEDASLANEIADVLAVNDLDPWLDTRNLLGGDDWEREIERGIQSANAFVVLISAELTSQPRTVANHEIRLAIEESTKRPPGGRWIIPVTVDGTAAPAFRLPDGRSLTSVQAVDYHTVPRPAAHLALLTALGVMGPRGLGAGPVPLRIIRQDSVDDYVRLSYFVDGHLLTCSSTRDLTTAIGSSGRHTIQSVVCEDAFRPVGGGRGTRWVGTSIEVTHDFEPYKSYELCVSANGIADYLQSSFVDLPKLAMNKLFRSKMVTRFDPDTWPIGIHLVVREATR